MGKDRTPTGAAEQAAVPRDRRRRSAPRCLLAACGGGTDTPPGAGGGRGGGEFAEGKEYTGPNVSLAFWNGFTGGDGPFMQKLVDQFNAEHQNIKVSMNMIQWADFYPKVPTAVQSGNGPDVAIMHHRPAGHQRRPPGRSSRWTTSPPCWSWPRSDFVPAVWSAGVYKDKRYGLPLDVHPLALYYNTTRTWRRPASARRRRRPGRLRGRRSRR